MPGCPSHSHSPSPRFQHQHVSALCASNTTSLPPVPVRAPKLLVSVWFECAHSRALVFSLVVRVLPSSRFQTCSGVCSELPVLVWFRHCYRSSSRPAPQHRRLLLPGTRGYCFPVPSPFCLSSNICADSQLPASYLNTKCRRCLFVEIHMYLPMSQADFVGV